MSESQERMMAVVEPADVDAFLAICEKWDVDATVIGEVTDGDRLQIDWHGERVVDVPPRSVAHDGPTYHRPFARPDSQDVLQADGAERLPRPVVGRGAARDPAAPRRQPQPVRQVVDHRPVRPLRAGQHRPRAAQRQRHDPRRRRAPTSASRSRPTATAGSPGSTRTPARSSPSPSPTATSRPAAPPRWRSATASTSARPRTRP